MFETLKLSFSEAHWVVITIIAIYTWYLKRESASAQEMLDLRLRVVEIENAIKDMPSKVEIAQLQGQMNAINQQIVIVQKGETRIEDYLLDKKK